MTIFAIFCVVISLWTGFGTMVLIYKNVEIPEQFSLWLRKMICWPAFVHEKKNPGLRSSPKHK